MSFIIIENFDEPIIAMNEDGTTACHDTLEEAILEAEDMQDALIVNMALSEAVLGEEDIIELMRASVEESKDFLYTYPDSLIKVYKEYMANRFRKKYY